MANVTALSGVKLGVLIAEAAKAGIPSDRFGVKQAFLKLALRDESRGGGPLDERDLLALDEVVCDDSLADLVRDGTRMKPAHTDVADIVLALVDQDPAAFYLCIPPTKN